MASWCAISVADALELLSPASQPEVQALMAPAKSKSLEQGRRLQPGWVVRVLTAWKKKRWQAHGVLVCHQRGCCSGAALAGLTPA